MVDAPRMKYKFLGNSGLSVSALSFGNWLTGHDANAEEVQFQCFDKAIRSGVNFLDTAEVYGFGVAETILGNIIKRGDYDRDTIIVSTKFMASSRAPNARNLSRKHLIQGMRNSLKRLQLDYADIIFLHRPDHETPIRETLHSVSHLIDKGKADYWGTSEFSDFQLTEIYRVCDKYGFPYPNAEQCVYHMLKRERVEKELVPFFDQRGLGTTVWSPLAGGILTGKFNDGNVPGEGRYHTDQSLQGILKQYFSDDKKAATAQKLQALGTLANELQCTQAQLALAWVIKSDDVSTAIMGASRVEQVEQNLGALNVVDNLTPEVLGRIEEILGNRPSLPMNFRHNLNAPADSPMPIYGPSFRR